MKNDVLDPFRSLTSISTYSRRNAFRNSVDSFSISAVLFSSLGKFYISVGEKALLFNQLRATKKV